LVLVLGTGCGRWQPARTYTVTSQRAPEERYAAMVDLAKAEKYAILSEDPGAGRLRLVAKVSGNDKSFIDVEVAANAVNLTAAGHLVRDGKVHKSLSHELAELEKKLAARLGGTPAGPANATAAAAATGGTPAAWSEPASDPSVWGPGNFTCLPVHVPEQHKASLALRLSTGDNADVELSLAYAPELCRSPEKCKASGGCPALGIGDSERVNKLAARLKKAEITAQATLLDAGTPLVAIDLSQHGSIAQALSEMKR
jgi:hypothetical protein